MKNPAKGLSLFVVLLFSLAGCASPGHGKGRGSRGVADETGGAIDVSKVQVLGGDEASFDPKVDPSGQASQDPEQYDAIIVGSGLSGLSAASFLTDPRYGKKVLILEKEDHLGGLASWGQFGGLDRFSRGAAYWTDTYKEEQKILDYIGLGNFKKRYPIPEPIDAYMVRGTLYRGIWFPSTLKRLPASFTVFKWELEKANDEDYIPDQPLEEAPKMDLDRLDAAAWIRSMPARLSQRRDQRSRRIYARYERELRSGKLNASDPMLDVVELMDLYCRSALGGNANQVSAMAFANFYISEIVTRYTTPIGTAQAAQNMAAMLQKRGLATFRTSAPVVRITNFADHVEVRYVENGQLHAAEARYAVYAAALKFAPRIIEGMSARAPEQASLMQSLPYAHYSVDEVEVRGHPYRGAYDTWSHAVDYTENDPTDMILGRWVALDGYRKKLAADDTTDVFTVYHPLPPSVIGNYSKDEAAGLAASGVDRILTLYKPIFAPSFTADTDWKSRNVLKITTNIWPYSIHIAEPGHYIHKVKILRRPFERVIFANNNLGTPAFEEALFRGHCGANEVLKRLVPDFRQEPWSRCPLE